jgi:hypothetical protein
MTNRCIMRLGAGEDKPGRIGGLHRSIDRGQSRWASPSKGGLVGTHRCTPARGGEAHRLQFRPSRTAVGCIDRLADAEWANCSGVFLGETLLQIASHPICRGGGATSDTKKTRELRSVDVTAGRRRLAVKCSGVLTLPATRSSDLRGKFSQSGSCDRTIVVTVALLNLASSLPPVGSTHHSLGEVYIRRSVCHRRQTQPLCVELTPRSTLPLSDLLMSGLER